MKHSFLTLIALLMSISYAFADTHTVYFYDDPNEPAYQSIVDQDNNSYEVPNGYAEYAIPDGTVLTFTLTNPSQVVFCYDEITGDELGMGFTFTITESTPEAISFAAGDPYGIIEVKVPNACNVLTGIVVNGMNMSDNYCRLHEDGYYYMRIPDLYEGDVVELTSSVDIDWGNGEIGKNHTFTVGEITPETSTITIIGTDVWDDNNPDHYTSTIPGPLTITYINRTIFAKMWNPICFPFNLDQEKMERIFGINTVVQFEDATFSEADGLTVVCSYVTGGLQANTPYLVNPEANLTNMKFENVGVQNFNGGRIDGNAVNFVGIVRPTALTANDRTKLFIGTGNKVYYPDQDMTIKDFRGYFEVPASSPVQGRKPGAARFVIRDHKAPTGVENNVMDENNATKYMQDGRLVIENNGVRYNAQGLQID
ncbi:MAG: hypothetical protein J6Y00_06625 [Paludibacteraceae bacterium]|nr:hypothetical protein [Paludibacteraceae bacterium]